jgi:TPR repeat protein
MKYILITLLALTSFTAYCEIPKEAYQAYDKGEFDVCSDIADVFDEGLGGYEIDYAKAYKYYIMACDKDEAIACANLGYLYKRGNGVKKNNKTAIAYFTKSCDLDDEVGCLGLGYMYDSGTGVKQDKKKANSYYVLACDNDSNTACYNFAINYEYGDGVKMNTENSASL